MLLIGKIVEVGKNKIPNLRTLGCMCLFQIWFPWCVCPEVGLLGHMEVLFPVF